MPLLALRAPPDGPAGLGSGAVLWRASDDALLELDGRAQVDDVLQGLRRAGVRQLPEPGGFDAYAPGDQGRLAEERRKVGTFVGIASVEGRQRVQARVGHVARARMIECASYP